MKHKHSAGKSPRRAGLCPGDNTEPTLLRCQTKPGPGTGPALENFECQEGHGHGRESPEGTNLGRCHRRHQRCAPRGIREQRTGLEREGEFGQGAGIGFPGIAAVLGLCRSGARAGPGPGHRGGTLPVPPLCWPPLGTGHRCLLILISLSRKRHREPPSRSWSPAGTRRPRCAPCLVWAGWKILCRQPQKTRELVKTRIIMINGNSVKNHENNGSNSGNKNGNNAINDNNEGDDNK